jgi:hypothetical protein
MGECVGRKRDAYRQGARVLCRPRADHVIERREQPTTAGKPLCKGARIAGWHEFKAIVDKQAIVLGATQQRISIANAF